MNGQSHPPVHDWLHPTAIAHVPGPTTPLLDAITARLLESFASQGHSVLAVPAGPPQAQVLISTALFGQPVHFRDSLTLTARRRYGLEHAPLVFTLLHAQPGEWQRLLAHLEQALAPDAPDPAQFAFPGMAEMAYHTLFEQGKRGGPLMAVARIVQSQAMSIRNIVVVGEAQTPWHAYTFDLVGAHPCTQADRRSPYGGDTFIRDLMFRILTATCTHEITRHQIEEPPVPRALWQSLDTPPAMIAAGRTLGQIGFFTEMVKVANLVDVPLLDHAIASQYSEGCYATWDPTIEALVCTITGSARPVDKGRLTEDELAVITGIRADGQGARVRHVEGKRNDPPSSEAVEMVSLDEALPRITFQGRQVPVARSKLHGHRSVRAFDPRYVEHVPLSPAYYSYPVSCSTEAQAQAIQAAFGSSAALQNPSDPRMIVFTILPGHGVLMAEKWAEGKAPFDLIHDAIRDGQLVIDNAVPQGLLAYREGDGGYQVLVEESLQAG